MTAPLASGSAMPALTARDFDGETVDLTAAAAGNWSVILLYRGHW